MWRESLASGDVLLSVFDKGNAERRESLATGAKNIRHGYALAVLYRYGCLLGVRGF